MRRRIERRQVVRGVAFGLLWWGLAAAPAPPALAVPGPPPPPEGGSLEDLIPPAPAGAVSWRTLGQVKTYTEVVKGESFVRPKFDKTIASLDGQEITIKGFMFPLEMAEKQSRFVLSAYPPSCPFCLPGEPSHLIEVNCAKPVAFTYNPVLIKGRLHLLRNDPYGLFYRMTGARLVGE